MAKSKFKHSWKEINWKQCNNYVQNVQFKMVVAYKNGNLKLVLKLQYKLMKSFPCRALAVRQVVTNDGCLTPGVDKEV